MDREAREAARKEKRRYWEKHIESWRLSGMKQRPYCRKHDLKFHQFVYWRKKYQSCIQPAVSLVRVSLPEGSFQNPVWPTLRPVRLVMGTGHRIELERDFDPIALKQLIQTLEQQ